MNLLDTNVWMALALSTHECHELARDWFARQSQAASVLFCRATQQSFVRLMTTDSVMRPYEPCAMSNADAWRVYEGFIADPRVVRSEEPRHLEARWKVLATRKTASPKLWMDAYLAAFAIEGRHRLVTFDHAFAQFKGLDTAIL